MADSLLYSLYMKKLTVIGMVFGLVIGFANTASAASALSAAPAIVVHDHDNDDTAQWGGEGISIRVNKDANKSTASILFDCASGNVTKIQTDGNGGFVASGTYTQGSGVRPPHPPVPQPAHYVGVAKNGVMSLMVVLDSNTGANETFLLKKGSFGHVMLCE